MNCRVFESTKQAEEYLAGIKAKSLALKFGYIGPAAYTHDALLHAEGYRVMDAEIKLFKAQFCSLSASLFPHTSINVLDVGSGNGVKAITVLQILKQKFRICNYLALDYSKELLKIAQSNLAAALPNLPIIAKQHDFEARDFGEIVQCLRLASDYPALFLLLGQTLGNLPNPRQSLSNIRVSMGGHDKLLLSFALLRYSQTSEILAPYLNEIFYQAVFMPLTFCGFERTDGKIEVLFNDCTNNVEAYFHLTKDATVGIWPLEEITFHKGDRLLVFVSHRFIESEILRLFKEVGLMLDNLILDDNQLYGLAVVSIAPRRVVDINSQNMPFKT